MALIPRALQQQIINHKPPKAMVLFGPRRAGKTTLLELATASEQTNWLNGDNLADIRRLNIESADGLRTLLGQSNILVIDEAQRVPSIGLLLKRLVDINIKLEKPVQIFATGSSTFELATGVKESALGRLKETSVWPLSTQELAETRGWGSILGNLNWHMVYGMLPEICTFPEDAKDNLMSHCNSLLFKDVFTLGGIRNQSKLEHLVQYLAYNVGSVINYDNIGREIDLNKGTVAEYISLLEQCFVIKVCHSYSKNLSNELKKSKKIYFCDNGIRNAVIGDFSPIETRNDAGALWENFFFTERLKYHSIKRTYARIYFWRTRERSPREIDFIEIADNKMRAFECKLSANASAVPPSSFVQSYPDCSFTVVNPQSLMELWAE